jgi:hypothetical protein
MPPLGTGILIAGVGDRSVVGYMGSLGGAPHAPRPASPEGAGVTPSTCSSAFPQVKLDALAETRLHELAHRSHHDLPACKRFPRRTRPGEG